MPSRTAIEPANYVASPVSISELWRQRRWFELKEAIRLQQHPAIYQLAVACAFENNLRIADWWLAKLSPDETEVAYRLLVWIYLRQAKFRSALRCMDALLTKKPGDHTLIASHTFLAKLSKTPTQRMLSRRGTTVPFRKLEENIFIPASIVGQEVQCMLDSGATWSFITESQAQACGLVKIDAAFEGVSFFGVTGATTGFSMAVAKRVNVGRLQLANVPFIILPDHRFPFPSGFGAAFGLSVLLEFKTLVWSSSGECQLAFPSRTSETTKPNLCFDNADLVTETTSQSERLRMVFDTGNSTTVLWKPVSKHLQETAEDNLRSTLNLSGVSGAAEVNTLILPELHMSVGGYHTELRPAHMLVNATTPNSRWLSGRLGMDVLSQASRVSLDFTSMTAQLT